MTEPNGCRWCGLPQRLHYQQWTKAAGWHGHVQPTDQQRLQRMRDRRESRQAMAVKGRMRPYRVNFTYPKTEQCPDGIKANHVFDHQDVAERKAQEIAQRGGTATVEWKVGTDKRVIAVYAAWTAEQHRLVELAEQVSDLAYASEVDEDRRLGLAVSRELRTMALEQLNVTRY